MAPLETETWLEVFAREREEREALTKALEQHGQNKAALSDSYQHEKAAVEARHEQELVDLAARHKEEMTQLAAPARAEAVRARCTGQRTRPPVPSILREFYATRRTLS